jgi:ketosteroid isomerase-like protein
MQTQARNVVERYYSAFDAHESGWQDLVTDDVVFDGPVQHARGRAELVEMTAQFLQAHRGTRLLGRIADGNRVASLYEFDLDAPDGRRMTCPLAEWATVDAGRISEFRVYYDPRDFMRAFGIPD